MCVFLNHITHVNVSHNQVNAQVLWLLLVQCGCVHLKLLRALSHGTKAEGECDGELLLIQ